MLRKKKKKIPAEKLPLFLLSVKTEHQPSYPLTQSLNTPSGALNDPLGRGNSLTTLRFGRKIYLATCRIINLCLGFRACVCDYFSI